MNNTDIKSRSFGTMMSGQHEASTAARDDGDFFPTPPEATHAFMRAEGPLLRARWADAWEPACGEGDISDVLWSYGFDVLSTDLIDRGYGKCDGICDFLMTEEPGAPVIITNPPYKDDLPEKFVRHAHRIGVSYIAMLLKAQFFNAGGRAALWRDMMPARVYHLGFRCDFLGLGRPTMDCDWWVWEFPVAHRHCIDMGILERPQDISTRDLFSGAPHEK